MGQNDLKRYTVKVNEGSGCIFQPMDDAHTYILTAKHLFQTSENIPEERSYLNDGAEIAVTFYLFDGSVWQEEIRKHTLKLEENFFPHSNVNVDAAILKIALIEGYDNIHIRENRLSNTYYLCGCPGRQRREVGTGDDYDSFNVREFKQSGNYFDIAVLNNDIITDKEIKGTSGGGIMAYNDSSLFVTGIQSRMAANVDLNLGRVGYVPIDYFNQIVIEHKNKLEPLLPAFLKSFVSLIDDTFKLESANISKEEAALSELLNAKAQFIRQSDLTPLQFKSFMGDNRLLVKDQDSIELRKKKIWTFWLELLVILNIAKEKVHNFQDIEEVISKIRFFYSDTNRDFLTEHLQDLWKLDYSDLEDEGLVIFASNQVYQRPNTTGILNLCDFVQDISSVRRAFEIQQNQAIASGLIDISDASNLPFDRFKYTSISTFKEYAAIDLEQGFTTMDSEDCYPLLKELYERLLP